MKKLTLVLLICFLTNIALADTTTTSETSLNQTLLDNAKASRDAIKAKETTPTTEIKTLGKGSNVNTLNLTDQEKQLSENYIHQGKANEIIKASCGGDMQAACSGNEGPHKFMGMDPNMVKAVAQAYAMFGALAGDSLGSITKGDAALKKDAEDAGVKPTDKAADPSATPTAASKADKKANDYCKYIPTVTEGISTAIQMAKSKELNAEEIGNGDTAQKDALLKAAKSHDSRAKMAQVQAAGWWGGAACYAVNAATGQFAVDKNLAIKMGAATLLGAFYQSEVSANKGYADKTRAIANKLPGKGDCNPITDNVCYCSQPSTENDATYCLKGLHNKTIATTSYRVACTDSTLKIDPTCTCEKSNSCFDTYLDMQSDGNLQIGLGSSSSPFTAIRSLARGELVGGTLNSQSYDKTAAIAKKGIQEVASKLPNDSNLTKDQKAIADAMMTKGVPANVAALMAQNPPSSGAMNAAMAKLSGASGGVQYASLSPKGSHIVDFSGGNGLGYKGNTKTAGSNGAEDILSKFKPAGKAAVNSKILEFAEKAENQARQNGQIRKGNDTPLFEIISLRYQTSGRRLLEVDSSN